jgi:hypothetical protein
MARGPGVDFAVVYVVRKRSYRRFAPTYEAFLKSWEYLENPE